MKAASEVKATNAQTLAVKLSLLVTALDAKGLPVERDLAQSIAQDLAELATTETN